MPSIFFNPEWKMIMSRWDQKAMLSLGEKLFKKIHKRKVHSHPNHDIHFLAREIDQWLPEGISSLIKGCYDPRCLTRYYFSDERVDQLHISDRIFQHVLLKIVKPTFKYVMNTNCYHLDGPSGVKNATQKIQAVLQNSNLKYFIRTDIKSFYRSIPHHKLIQEIKKYYNDPKLIAMLINIIKNPIDTPYGYKNPDCGIALRGPLSQFFSGLYLKPLDDSISTMCVTYLRYQDDILILCNTKRQLNRCKRKMMAVMHERHLCLSKRKTRFGAIEESGFHFLGILYPPTRTEDNTNTTPVKLTEASGEEATHKARKDKQEAASALAYKSNNMGGGRIAFCSTFTGNFAYSALSSTCTHPAQSPRTS